MVSLNFSPFPERKTERLLLRQMQLADAKGVLQLRSDETVMQYINRPLAKTIEDAQKWIQVVSETLEKNEGITWCLALKEKPDVHIGSIGLWRIEKENFRAEIGYMLEPSMQGRGLMYEALLPVLEFGFKDMKLHTIVAQIDPMNTASAALLKKGNFVQEAPFKQSCFYTGRFSDTAVYTKFSPYHFER